MIGMTGVGALKLLQCVYVCMYVCMYVPAVKHEVRFCGSVKEQVVASWRRIVLLREQ